MLFKDIDGSLFCEWQVNLHNVSGDALDKATFHTTDCTFLQTWADGFDVVVRFDANGTFNGEPGYTAIFRMEDYTEPGDMDTLRIEIYGPGGFEIYDTSDGDFLDQSSNIGSNRTFLDNGNIQIWFYE